MAQPAQVRIEEGAQVGDAVFQHRDPVDPHAEGKALPFRRVHARRRQHLGMHHAGPQHFQPVVALAHLHGAAFPGTLDVDLGRGFGEGEMGGAEAGLHSRAEIGREEFLEHPFQIRHGDIAVDRQAFDLVEHRRMRLVVIGTVHATRRNRADWRALRFHRPDLHRRGMGAQHVRRAVVAFGPVHVERVHLGPGGVMAGNVQRVEIVPVGFDLRPFGDGKAHIGKDRRDLFPDLRHGVHGAGAAVTPRQGHVQPFGLETFVQRGIGQRGLLGRQRGVDLVLERVQRRAGHLALFGRHLAQFAHFEADFALLANGLNPQILKAGFIRRLADRAQPFCLQIVHPRSS